MARLISFIVLILIPIGCTPRSQTPAVHDSPAPWDVVVVGAGMAGLTVAHELDRRDLRVLVLERQDRIGGRVHTDYEQFSAPVEIGGAWIHDSTRNPLMPLVKKFGLHTVADDQHTYRMCTETGLGNAEEAAEVRKRFDALDEKLVEAGKRGEDGPADHTIEIGNDDGLALRWLLSTAAAANRLAEISPRDYASQVNEVDDRLVVEGMQQVVEKMAQDLTIRLGQTVTSVAWDEDPIVVRGESTEGPWTYRAGAVVLAVAPHALLPEHIVFDPPLPKERLAAIHGIRMAPFAKVIVELPPEVLDHWPRDQRIIDAADPNVLIEFLRSPFSAGIVTALLGGAEARDIESSPSGQALQTIVSHLEHCLGTTLGEHVMTYAVTSHSLPTWQRGAWSTTQPHHYDARETLAQPLESRLYFAGEALAESDFRVTITGAYESGLHVAQEILANHIWTRPRASENF